MFGFGPPTVMQVWDGVVGLGGVVDGGGAVVGGVGGGGDGVVTVGQSSEHHPQLPCT